MANTSNHNSGRSWNADRRQRNKNESWEKPMSKRKQRYDNGGGVFDITDIPYYSNVYLVVDNSPSAKYFITKDGMSLIEKYDEIISNFRNYFDNIKVLTSVGNGVVKDVMENEMIYDMIDGFDLESIIDWVKIDDELNNSYVIILTDGNESFDIDFTKNTIILTTEEGKETIEKYYPNISPSINNINDIAFYNEFKDGGGIGGKVRMKLQDEGGFDEYLEEINFNFNENKIEFEDEDIIIVSKDISEKFENDGVAYVLMGNELYKNGGGVKDWMNEKTRAVIITIQKNRPKGFHKKNGQHYIYTSYIADVADDMGIILTGKEMRLIAEGFNGSKFDNGGGVGEDEKKLFEKLINKVEENHKQSDKGEYIWVRTENDKKSNYSAKSILKEIERAKMNGFEFNREKSSIDKKVLVYQRQGYKRQGYDTVDTISYQLYILMKNGGGVGNIDWNNFSMQDVLNEYKKLKIDGEYEWQEDNRHWNEVGNLQTKFTLEGFDIGTFGMGEILHITLQVKNENIDASFNDSDGKRKNNRVRAKFIANIDFVNIKPNQQGGGLLDIKRMASDIVEQFPNYGGYDKEIFSKGGGINSGRDLLFKSQEPHEQAYKRKREFKKYGDNGNWYNDFFENGGGIGNQNALMVMNDNKQIKHHTEELNKVVDTNTTVPAWIVAKVHRSASDLSDASHYLDGVNTEFKNGGDVGENVGIKILKYYDRKKDKWIDLDNFKFNIPYSVFSDEYKFPSIVVRKLEQSGYYVLGQEFKFIIIDSFANGGNVSYSDIKKEKERMTDELLKKCGVFFAFSNEQFNENKTPLKEGEKYVSIGGGGYMPKGNIDAFSEGMKSISKLGKKKVKENNLAETEILYELKNHECFYTGDYSDVVDMFKGTYTEEQIRDVYNKHRESNQTFKNGGGVSSDIIFVWAKNKEDRDRFFESVTNLMPDHFIIKQGDLSVQLEVNPSDMSSIEQMAKTYNVEVIIDNGVEPSADYGDLISINIAEKALGRKINSWKDDVIALDGISYRKVFLKPEYKKIK